MCAEIVDKPVDHDLGREDSHQSHVVPDADGPALAKLLNESRDRAGVEDAVSSQLIRRQQVLDVFTLPIP